VVGRRAGKVEMGMPTRRRGDVRPNFGCGGLAGDPFVGAGGIGFGNIVRIDFVSFFISLFSLDGLGGKSAYIHARTRVESLAESQSGEDGDMLTALVEQQRG
jgi:hypothetical protein